MIQVHAGVKHQYYCTSYQFL